MPLLPSLTEPLAPRKHVLICQNRTCIKQGASSVFTAFQTHPVPGCIVTKTGCMGQCGNGPMVRVLPDDIWYWQVQPSEVPAIVERHLRHNQPIKAMIYARFHSNLSQQ